MKFGSLAVLILGIMICAASFAAGAAELIGVSDESIQLETGKGVLLRIDRPARTIFVADPTIADIQVKSPRLIYLLGKKPGDTSLYVVDADERVILSRPVQVSHNLSRLKSSLRRLLPNAAIDVSSIDETLVLTGAAATAQEAEDARRLARRLVNKDEEIVNRIAVTAPNQVQLRVRIAEVSRDVVKEFGIAWEGVIRNGSFAFGLGFGRDFITDAGTIPRTQANSAVSEFASGGNQLAGIIDALEEQGLITILAEPNLTALSGEKASFLAGGEFPIVVPGEDGNTIQFKKFGVSLAFTPTLISESRISLVVKPEVSQLSTEGAIDLAGFTIPSLTTRRASTTVELASGQSFAIAGLLQNNLGHTINKVPGLADLPILGALFRSDRFRRDETELVILVTPYVVRPVSAVRFASPTDGLTPPTDIDRIVNGRLYRPSLNRRRQGPAARGSQGLVGPVGFMLN